MHWFDGACLGLLLREEKEFSKSADAKNLKQGREAADSAALQASLEASQEMCRDLERQLGIANKRCSMGSHVSQESFPGPAGFCSACMPVLHVHSARPKEKTLCRQAFIPYAPALMHLRKTDAWKT